eukprot:GGOE01018420.1.p1 GENE.GGOE01018420.1~~GGOE01018420.1.p1  ORF type:complete len:1175 (+),score=378.43 GGOE01018420.1:51-3575(+)
MQDPEPEIVCRRATLDDATPARLLAGEDFAENEKRFGNYSVRQLIEKSYFTITAFDAKGELIGLAVFNDCPSLSPEIPQDAWYGFVLEFYDLEVALNNGNTLWMVFFVSTPGRGDEVINSIFASLYTTLPDTDHILFALRSRAGDFPPVTEYFSPLKERPELEQNPHRFPGSIMWSPREHVIPSLRIRKGKVEDYDDLMPLLLAQSGVLTEMGEDFYLEDLLEQQDPLHCVLVAEDSETSAIVGLMCTSSSVEDNQFVLKHFNFEAHGKLRRWHQQGEREQTHGSRNCFQIDFFYLNVDYECRAMDFLPPAFQQFPSTEYCFIRLPHSIPDHALLAKFQYIPLKPGLTLKQGCFLVSRYALDVMDVRLGVVDDLDSIRQLLASQTEMKDTCDVALEHVKAAVEEAPENEFVVPLLHKADIVGLLHARSLEDMETFNLLAEYDIDSKIDFFSANLHCEEEYRQIGLAPLASPLPRTTTLPGLEALFFFVKPMFRCHTRLFLRETLKLLQKEVLYYKTAVASEVSGTLMAELILALPRRQMSQHSPLIPTAAEGEELSTVHFTSRRLLSEVKTRINSRIVVVGASTTGLSFIYTLLALPYLHFSNIILVSRDGLPQHPDEAPYTWFTDTLGFRREEYALFNLRCKVRIIEGTLVDFERTEKYVVTHHGMVEPYDHLVITAGRQYTVPKEMCAPQRLARNGIFPLSSKAMIESMMQHVNLSEVYEEEGSHCVIYGASLDSYCVLTSLMQLGIPPSRLAIVAPAMPGVTDESVFHDPYIENKVFKLCDAMGIKVYKEHVLEHLEYNEDDILMAIYIRSQVSSESARPPKDQRTVELACTMLVYCHEKDIDPTTLSALNKRSIVFDGRVIVENNYRTADKHIYAAGPIAMFSRRFGPSEPFETYSSMEVGAHLCHTVLAYLGVEEFKSQVEEEQEDADGIDREQLRKERRGQLFSDEAAQLAADKGQGDLPVERPKPLPTYTANVMWRVLLPGDYHYFHCQMQRCNPQSVAKAKNISTEDESGDSYIRISVDQKQYIQSISYFGGKPIEVQDLKVLVGMPQTYLNLVQRWDDGLITDVVAFLRQSWAMAVYYDKMQAFTTSLQAKFRAQMDIQMLNDYVLEHVQNNELEAVDEARRKRYGMEVAPQTQHLVELELIKFLHQNKEFLPIYFLPDVSPYIL